MLDIKNGLRNLQYLDTNFINDISHQCVERWSDLKVKVLVDSFLQDGEEVLMDYLHSNFGKVLVDSPLLPEQKVLVDSSYLNFEKVLVDSPLVFPKQS